MDKLLLKPVCGNCKTVLEFPRQPLWAKNESFDRAVAHWPETLLVIFVDPVCLFCKIANPLIEDLAREKAGKLKIMKVDIETETDMAQRFKIVKTPTFIVYKNAKEVLRVDGPPKEKTDLVKWIENLIDFTSY
jgi:thioredoxin-like negative regulator of GroEL